MVPLRPGWSKSRRDGSGSTVPGRSAPQGRKTKRRRTFAPSGLIANTATPAAYAAGYCLAPLRGWQKRDDTNRAKTRPRVVSNIAFTAPLSPIGQGLSLRLMEAALARRRRCGSQQADTPVCPGRPAGVRTADTAVAHFDARDVPAVSSAPDAYSARSESTGNDRGSSVVGAWFFVGGALEQRDCPQPHPDFPLKVRHTRRAVYATQAVTTLSTMTSCSPIPAIM